jgi:MtfA peptidase
MKTLGFIIIGIIAVILILLIQWKNIRRRIVFKDFSNKWKDFLKNEVPFYNHLNSHDKTRFEKDILAFLNRVKISGIDTDVDDTDRLLIASSAVIPIFGFPEWKYYPNLDEVLLYPDTFNEKDYQTEGEERNVLGMVGSGVLNRKMILSKPALHESFRMHGHNNVGIHEFAHLLDKMDGATDGVPENLLGKQYIIPWMKLMHDEIQKILEGKSDLNPYGSFNKQEFFAVASEYFFQDPVHFKNNHPELYKMIDQIFHRDHYNK